MTTATAPAPPARGRPVDGAVAATAPPGCSCGAAVRWVRTTSGDRVPLELDSHPEGNVTPGRDEHDQLVAQVLTRAAARLSRARRWRAHLPLCPAAVPDPPVHARPGGLELSNVRCRVCGDRLPLALLSLLETTHPNCAPAGAGRRDAKAASR